MALTLATARRSAICGNFSCAQTGWRKITGMKLGPLLEAALYASDLSAAEEFYHGVLGLEVVSRMEGRGISFCCGVMVLLVFDPARTRMPDAGVPTHGASGAGHIAFAMDETELEGWREHLRAHGVAIESEVEWSDVLRSIYFRDPAGNVVELAPPGLWSAARRSR